MLRVNDTPVDAREELCTLLCSAKLVFNPNPVAILMVSSRPTVMFFVGVALVGVAFGFSLALASTYGVAVFRPSNQWGVLVSGILACAYAAYAFISPRRFDFESYFRPVVPIIVLGLLSMRLSVALASAIIIAGFQLADMLSWIVLSWISSHSGLPQRVFCMGREVRMLVCLLAR